MRLLALSLLGLLLVGCGAGRFPTALSRRPLLAPEGHHRVTLIGGAYKAANGFKPLVGFGYRGGIRDNVEYAFPVIVGIGGPVAENLEIVGRGGLYGLGLGGAQKSRRYRADPRYPPFEAEEGFYTQLGVGALARTTLGPDAGLTGSVDAISIFGARGVYLPLLVAAAHFTFDPIGWLSFSLGGQLGLSGETTTTLEDDFGHPILVLGSDFFDPGRVPTIALHLAEELDIIGVANWVFGVETGGRGGNLAIGIDWHFD